MEDDWLNGDTTHHFLRSSLGARATYRQITVLHSFHLNILLSLNFTLFLQSMIQVKTFFSIATRLLEDYS
jgi:hypothetical protein